MRQVESDPTLALAAWSDWAPFDEAVSDAPRQPGVYMARIGDDGPIVYVGCAGPRAGSGAPKGLWGRLRVYASGKAFTSGLGEAVADRALADPAFLEARLEEVRAGRPMRATDWGRAAFAHLDLHIRWATTSDKATALVLERTCYGALPPASLWNRRPLHGAP